MIDQATWIKNPLAVWTGTQLSAPNGLVICGDKIVELVTTPGPTVSYSKTMDATDCVIIPGLVNCHHHFYQTLTRALPIAANKPLFPWLESLYPIWANLDEQAIAVSTEVALSEMLLSGCTTASDHHYVFPPNLENAIDIQATVAKEMGMRVVLTRGSMSLGKSNGGLPPDSVVQTEQTILDDSQRLIDTWHQPSDGPDNVSPMTQIALAPCSPFSVTKALMIQTAELARENNVLLHTHLAETEDENQFCLDSYGVRPLDYLAEVGWLSNQTWLAHGIHFNRDEIKRLGDAGTGVCHCPSSNMILASGICPVTDLEAAGSPVGLGVDGSASNDCSNLMQEVRQAFLMQRLRSGAEDITADRALKWGTQGGANLLRRNDIGSIDVGKQADLALFKLDELRFAGAGAPIDALVTCGAHRAEHVMVNGAWRVTDGQIVNSDLGSLRQRQIDVAHRLVNL